MSTVAPLSNQTLQAALRPGAIVTEGDSSLRLRSQIRLHYSYGNIPVISVYEISHSIPAKGIEHLPIRGFRAIMLLLFAWDIALIDRAAAIILTSGGSEKSHDCNIVEENTNARAGTR